MCAVSLLVLTGDVQAKDKAPKEIAREAFRSTVTILTSDKDGQLLAIGSGFVVAEGVVATNAHVLTDAASAIVRLTGKEKHYSVAGVLALDGRNDLALLSATALKAPTLPLRDSKVGVEIGDPIYAIGSPRGLGGTFSDGIVSGVRKFGNESLVQITAPISPGSSGGPILDAEGTVLGVAVATLRDGQNLNFAVPVAYLQALLKVKRSLRSLSKLGGEELKAKSTVSESGASLESGIEFRRFSWKYEVLDTAENFSVSIRNRLPNDVELTDVLVVFRDDTGEPVSTMRLYGGPVRKKVPLRMKVDARLARIWSGEAPEGTRLLIGTSELDRKVEFRVLGVKVVR